MRRRWEKITKDTAPFTSLLSEVHRVPVLRVSGEIILGTGEQFRAALKQAVDEVERTEGTGRVLVVDFSELSSLDSTGLSALMQETADLRKRGGEVRLVIAPGGRMGRILGITGVGDMFSIYSDAARATEERRGGPTA
jgi:anti-anti-sigma factor